MSAGKSSAIIIVDQCSKFAHSVAIKYPFVAAKIGQIFFDEIFKLYDLPKTTISDSNRVFASEFWPELFKLQETQT